MNKQVEKQQSNELIRYYKVELKPAYPELILIVIENRGYKSIVTEESHPDLLWKIYHNGNHHWLYHELKKTKGTLDADQKTWWAKFEETDLVKGIVTKGLYAHFDGINNWLNSVLSS